MASQPAHLPERPAARSSTRPARLTVPAAALLLAGLAVSAPGLAASAAGPGQGPGRGQPAVPHFVDEARAAGVEHTYEGSWEFFVGGGVAAFDCDADGRPDLYLAGGTDPAALFRNESPTGGTLRFTRLRDEATDLDRVTGAYPLDIDADGNPDLAILRHGEDVLLRGLGECRFERANEAWGFEGSEAWTTAFSATWEQGAEWPTLAFGTYIDHVATDGTTTCGDSHLVRPNETGDGFGRPVVLPPAWCALSMLFSDWDRSGRRDLRVANDRHYYRDGQEQLWRIEPGHPPRAYTRRDGWQQLRIWGMGIASQDLTGDGYPEVFLTSIGDNKLQTLAQGPGQPAYRDIALKRGVTAHRPFTGGETLPSTAWHAEFQDVNNDGRVDLFVSKGNVEAMKEYAMSDPSNLFLGRADGSFVEAAEAASIVDFARGRGAALVDLNLDGLLDLVKVNRRENVRLWRNVGAGDAATSAPLGGWLAVRLTQDGPNRDAVGAWVEVRVGRRTVTRELVVGGGHAGGQLGWLHFGLAHAGGARLRVQWPDGEWSAWMPAMADRFIVVERGAAEPSPWTPPGS